MTDEKKLLESQQAVLGAMLIDEKTVGLVLQDVTPDDFTTGAYRQIFLAFRAQFASGAACDPVTVNARLGGKYDRLLMELIEITPTSANVKSYVAILKQEARIHRLQDVAQRMLEAEDEDALRALMSEANALSVERPGLRVVSMEDALSKFYVRHDPDAKPVYLDFGMDDINDNVYAGRGDMIVIGGYPSDGKTSLALTLAVRMAKTQRVGFYSYETDADKLFDRIVAMTAQVGLPKLKLNAMNGNDWDAVAAVSARLGAVKLELVEASGMTVQDIRAHSLSKRYDVIFIDYLQKIKSDITGRASADQFQVVSKISSDLQQFGRQTGTPVIALSQLSRPEKTKGGKIPPPTLSALRSSGQIEQDADVVMLLYREEPDNSHSRRILNIAKNKEGEANIALMLTFDGQTQTFRKSAAQAPLPPQDKRWQPCNDDIPEQFKLPG